MSDARATIAVGSKSFFFASLFFPATTRTDVWKLYQWCRHCDDVIDMNNNDRAALELAQIRSQTVAALENQSSEHVFKELGAICRSYDISREFPLELLAGFSKDVAGTDYLSIQDVEAYAYQVAGVIGIMMTSIMGVRDLSARSHAVALGNAMQLTNIARDVADDFKNGRVYLPKLWLASHGVDVENLFAPESRDGLFQVVLMVLDRADVLYQEGFSGLRYLPFRAAVAVAAAGEIYSRIGHKIRATGPAALERRIYVARHEKALLAIKGLWRAARSRW